MARRARATAAEVIADHFRRDIASGALQLNDALPPEGELIEHFGVSRPTLRSAFRILESEDLLVISRGPHGGPRVRHPDVDVTTRALGLLLHLRGTRVVDFFAARRILEPAAVNQLALTRPDAGIRALEALLSAETAVIDDQNAFTEHSSSFYGAITDHCGNGIIAIFGSVLQTLLLDVIRRLEEERGAGASGDPMAEPSIEQRHAVVDAHRRLVDLVSAGDNRAAYRHWLSHIEWLEALYPHLQGIAFSRLDPAQAADETLGRRRPEGPTR